MTAATVNGITIEYDVHGPDDGEPLLLVMGLGGQMIAWPEDFVGLLVEQGFRVVRLDNRDVGLSTKSDAPPPKLRQVFLALLARRWAKSTYTVADMAKDAVALLDHLGIAKAHVVGASMGGMIVQTIAIEHPGRVASMTSIMSNTGDRKHGKAKWSVLAKMARLQTKDRSRAIDNGVEGFRLISGPHFDAGRTRELLEAALARSDDQAGAARQMMAIAASPDRTPGLGRVKAPTLVVHGLLDPLVQPDGGMATAQAVPGARLVMYPDMAHDLPLARWPHIVGEIVETAREAGAAVGTVPSGSR
jgi:pimeloyl-ACP methyl ester carboxylesterase